MLKSWNIFNAEKKTPKEKLDSYSIWQKSSKLPPDAYLDELLVDSQARLLSHPSIDVEKWLSMVSGPGPHAVDYHSNSPLLRDLQNNAVIYVNMTHWTSSFVLQSIESFDWSAVLAKLWRSRKFSSCRILVTTYQAPLLLPTARKRKIVPLQLYSVPPETTLRRSTRRKGNNALPTEWFASWPFNILCEHCRLVLFLCPYT